MVRHDALSRRRRLVAFIGQADMGRKRIKG